MKNQPELKLGLWLEIGLRSGTLCLDVVEHSVRRVTPFSSFPSLTQRVLVSLISPFEAMIKNYLILTRREPFSSKIPDNLRAKEIIFEMCYYSVTD